MGKKDEVQQNQWSINTPGKCCHIVGIFIFHINVTKLFIQTLFRKTNAIINAMFVQKNTKRFSAESKKKWD